ncbi:MAG: TonB family protein [Dysgonamonadaceae bacterium]|jgi:protein TonB|nr:TonB family protein [Dysgonamonadaceae bacterium]
MAKDINLTSQEWLDLVFEGKNKEYGAYVLRDESSNRHIQALLTVVVLSLALIFIPRAIRSVVPQRASAPSITDEVKISQINTETAVTLPPVTQAKPAPVSVMEALKPTSKLVPPRIIANDKVKAENLMETQDVLTAKGLELSTVAQTGVPGGKVDPRDIIPPTTGDPGTTEGIIEPWVDQPPVFDHVLQWLSNRIKYPAIAVEKGIQGQVVLRFVVNKDGSVSDVKVVKSLDPSCDKEAVRVVSSMPKWIPGRKNGELVATYFTLPVTFKLQ